ncbi:MAG: hypothetical protein KAW17_04405 [Candidatus Eisenbacteria sp.]|nr:hypothetical protein [Candidatus Eisenbacteria bacterium]
MRSARFIATWLTAASLAPLWLHGCGGEFKTRPDVTPPEADLVARPPCGPVPLEVILDASESREDETGIIGYAWDIDGDGVDDTLTVDPRIVHTYANPGTVYVSVRVTNRDSLSSSAGRTVWAFDEDTDPSFCYYPNQRTSTVRGIEYTLGLDKAAYSRGDTLEFFYRISNGRPSTVRFPVHWTCLVDFHVFSGTCDALNSAACDKRWQYTDDVFCVNHPSDITIEPGSAGHFTKEWYPQFVLSPGPYTAFARVYHGPPSPSDSTAVWVRFEIE